MKSQSLLIQTFIILSSPNSSHFLSIASLFSRPSPSIGSLSAISISHLCIFFHCSGRILQEKLRQQRLRIQHCPRLSHRPEKVNQPHFSSPLHFWLWLGFWGWSVLDFFFFFFRYFLLKDVYDDMLLDGVQPIRDTFHSLIVGTMKGSRMQDAFFFRDEMKTLGLVPDVSSLDFICYSIISHVFLLYFIWGT